MLSIIIISKNEEEYLPRLLESIKSQDYKNYEIILSDAGSTDNTREIAIDHGCKIIDGGLPSKGRNNGAKIAKGDTILFLDSDVVLPKNFLRNNLKEFKNKNLVTATPIYKPITDKTVDKFLYEVYNAWAKATQYFYPHSAGFCIFCKKDTFNKLKGFNERILMAEDHDFVNRSKKHGKFRILYNQPILVDIRRLEQEGRFELVKKYFKGAIHRTFKGELYTPNFKYELHGGVEITKVAEELELKDK